MVVSKCNCLSVKTIAQFKKNFIQNAIDINFNIIQITLNFNNLKLKAFKVVGVPKIRSVKKSFL